MASNEKVNAEFCFCDPSVPALGLVGDTTYPYRVYALQCRNGCVYVGISHRSEVKRRVSGHFDGGAQCHYTAKNKPTSVLLVWPAISTAVESYVYHAFLGRMPASQLEKLGGWVQTSSRLSPLATLMHEEARRQLKGVCFNCGSDRHWARACKAPLHGCTYKCPKPGCGGEIVVSARGQSEPSVRPQVPAPRLQIPAPPPQVATPASPASPSGKKRKLSERSGKHALALGEPYTALSWYLGMANPTPKHSKLARAEAAEHALELKGCHCRSLDQQGFVATAPAKPKSLTGSRQRLGSEWAATDLEGVQIRRPCNGQLRCRLSQVLFRVSDLQNALAE